MEVSNEDNKARDDVCISLFRIETLSPAPSSSLSPPLTAIFFPPPCYSRNRLPNCSDDLSHWSDVFFWRQLHYKTLVKAYEGAAQVEQVCVHGDWFTVAGAQNSESEFIPPSFPHPPSSPSPFFSTPLFLLSPPLHFILTFLLFPQSNQAMVIVHHSASAIIQYARIARKHQLHSVCLDSLSKIHSIPSVPVLDCFQKIRQQVCLYAHQSVSCQSK